MQATSLRERNRSFFVALIITGLLLSVPQAAWAAGQPWETTAENTYNLIMSIIRWVAIIGVVGCGAAALFGKLSWDWAGKIILGLVLIFGGAQFVDYFKSGMGG